MGDWNCRAIFSEFFVCLFVPHILTYALGLPSKRLRRDFLDEKEVYAFALILSLVLTDPRTNINSFGGAKHIKESPSKLCYVLTQFLIRPWEKSEMPHIMVIGMSFWLVFLGQSVILKLFWLFRFKSLLLKFTHKAQIWPKITYT